MHCKVTPRHIVKSGGIHIISYSLTKELLFNNELLQHSTKICFVQWLEIVSRFFQPPGLDSSLRKSILKARVPTWLFGSWSTASPDLHRVQSSSLFPWTETVKHFQIYFLMEEANPWFWLFLPHHLQESLKLLIHSAESKGWEDEPQSKIVGASMWSKQIAWVPQRGQLCGWILSSLKQ